MSRERSFPATRILVVKLSSLGDLIHALPAVRMLKAQLGVPVDWVAHTSYVDLVRCFSDVDEVIAFPRHEFWREAGPFLRRLRARSYSHVLDLQGLLKSAWVARLARGAVRVGPSFAREGSRWLYSAMAGPPRRDRHAVDEVVDVVSFLGLRLLEPVFPVRFPRAPRAEPGPRIAFVPCSRWATKNWPPERFVEAGRALQREDGASIFLVGGPDDGAVCGAIARALPGVVVNLCGRTTLVELGGLLQEMDVVVSVDSGPLHLAAALGKPVVAVFGASDPARTGPYGKGHRILTAPGLECRPCRSRECRREDLACLEQVRASELVSAVRDALRGEA
jgi:lipopolysaccharide heptosyltransferase I